jgi:two-component system chemotaxis sensor kinase CheA
MSIDMQQFHAVFFEESEEHLNEMEQLLLQLNSDYPDPEALNSIFRAAHSIKGGAGIFGFDSLVGLTHILENILDLLRKGTITLVNTDIDIFLQAVDQLKLLLEGCKTNSAADTTHIQDVLSALASISSRQQTSTRQHAAATSLSDDEAFGFFDEVSDAASPLPASTTEPIKSDALIASPNDALFGFFDELLTNDPSSAAVKSVSNESNDVLILPVGSPTKKTENPIDNAIKKELTAKDPTSTESSSIRVDVIKVDQLINLVGEIVITQSMMNVIGNQLEGTVAEKFQSISGELERNTREIQEAVMSIRMLPISFVFNRFPRVVRDLSAKLGKEIELIIEGGETELDKGLTEKLVDPLTHLVRNSIDHGIEDAQHRQAHGKPEKGTVTLKALQQGGNILISISDDGAGLNREKILRKAQSAGITIADTAKDEDVWQLIFAPGFSTADEITDVSGRGVGMDVVKRNVQALGGRIDIQSASAIGTTITIHLPLTLAIVDGMCVSVGDQVFIIPLVNIIESMQPSEHDIKALGDKDHLLHVRNEYWPIVYLYHAMQLETDVTELHKGIVVLIEGAKCRFALFVDALIGQQQVVIKSLERHYKRIVGVAGATIMGDGSVALILDVDSLGQGVEKSSSMAMAI